MRDGDGAVPPTYSEHPQGRAVQALSLIGLALRARHAVAGSDACVAAIRARRAKLLVLAEDIGPNARKKYHDKCASFQIPLIERFDRFELGKACGREHVVAVAITDPGFAAKLMQQLGENGGGEAFGETSGL